MPDLFAVAERLRRTRAAQRRFLAMWAVDCLLERPNPNVRLQQDIQTGTFQATSDHNVPLLSRSERLDE